MQLRLDESLTAPASHEMSTIDRSAAGPGRYPIGTMAGFGSELADITSEQWPTSSEYTSYPGSRRTCLARARDHSRQQHGSRSGPATLRHTGSWLSATGVLIPPPRSTSGTAFRRTAAPQQPPVNLLSASRELDEPGPWSSS